MCNISKVAILKLKINPTATNNAVIEKQKITAAAKPKPRQQKIMSVSVADPDPRIRF